MGAERSAKVPSLSVTVLTAAAMPAPAAPPTQQRLDAFKNWQGGTFTPDAASLSIDADGADTVADGIIYGWDIADEIWRSIGSVNGGDLVTLTATIGFEQLLNDVGIFGALLVSGTTGAAIKTVKFTPVSQTE